MDLFLPWFPLSFDQFPLKNRNWTDLIEIEDTRTYGRIGQWMFAECESMVESRVEYNEKKTTLWNSSSGVNKKNIKKKKILYLSVLTAVILCNNGFIFSRTWLTKENVETGPTDYRNWLFQTEKASFYFSVFWPLWDTKALPTPLGSAAVLPFLAFPFLRAGFTPLEFAAWLGWKYDHIPWTNDMSPSSSVVIFPA